MCGIVGYVGDRPCRDILFEGLRKLEYRGYDSAGISILTDSGFELLHSVGNLDSLESCLGQLSGGGCVGIAHTRWATHGRPSEANAHPHTDCTERFAIVLNGIVENYLSLRAELIAEGHTFTSETDAEVVAHLIERAYSGSLQQALVVAYRQMEGHFTVCAVAVDEPDVIVGIRKVFLGFGSVGIPGRDPRGHLSRRWRGSQGHAGRRTGVRPGRDSGGA
jgi:glucosamine--fructose-6-phosphate aminotransferase (isomerizing)